MLNSEFVLKLKHTLRLLAVWYLIALTSLVAMFIVAQIPYSDQLSDAIEAGVREIESKANIIRNITETVSAQNEGTRLDQNQSSSSHFEKLKDLLLISLLIFGNNARVLPLLFVPFVGMVFYSIVIVYNGLVGRVLAESVFGSNWRSALISVLFLYPHSHLEILSYAIAVHSSTILGLKLIKSKNGENSFKGYWRYVVLSIVFLYLAALIESWMIIS